MKTIGKLFIVDIALNPQVKDFVLARFKTASEKYSIYYFDNHSLPPELTEDEIKSVTKEYRHSITCSTSFITFDALYGLDPLHPIKNRRQMFLAAYGAIADYAKKCDLLKLALDLWDEASIYYQAFLLKQACRIIESDSLKRTIADKLSVGILPSEIFEVVEAAREASREVDVAIEFVAEHAIKYGQLGVIVECPVASMGHNAFIAATTTNSNVGVAIRRIGGNARFVLRKKHDFPVHLGKIASIIAVSLNCDGGGEESAAGITAGEELIPQVLQALNTIIDKQVES
jgi:single-stranded DNA-specific DHH superfamily exonuclease